MRHSHYYFVQWCIFPACFSWIVRPDHILCWISFHNDILNSDVSFVYFCICTFLQDSTNYFWCEHQLVFDTYIPVCIYLHLYVSHDCVFCCSWNRLLPNLLCPLRRQRPEGIKDKISSSSRIIPGHLLLLGFFWQCKEAPGAKTGLTGNKIGFEHGADAAIVKKDN